MADFSFIPIPPRHWSGRYARIPGDTTAFHARLIGGRWWPIVEWTVGDETAQCPMAVADCAGDLAEAVNAGKRFLNGAAGGSFLIDEYGQVLVPDPSGDGDVAIIGECAGRMVFDDSLRGHGQFDLTDDLRLKTGDRWERPYVGVPYNLSQGNEIYFWHKGRSGSWKTTPPVQDDSLIDALRSIRPYGPVRFIATVGGLILTKVPIGDWKSLQWEPRFVGRIDYKKWFQKEA